MRRPRRSQSRRPGWLYAAAATVTSSAALLLIQTRRWGEAGVVGRPVGVILVIIATLSVALECKVVRARSAHREAAASLLGVCAGIGALFGIAASADQLAGAVADLVSDAGTTLSGIGVAARFITVSPWIVGTLGLGFVSAAHIAFADRLTGLRAGRPAANANRPDDVASPADHEIGI